MLYNCPKCHQPFDVDPKAVNETRSFSCPHCQAHFDFGATASQEVVPATEETISSAAQPAEEPAGIPAPEESFHNIETSGMVVAPKPAQGAEEETLKTKRCPFCGEEILAVALKCKHCGEILSANNPLYAALNIQPADTYSAPSPVPAYEPVQPVPPVSMQPMPFVETPQYPSNMDVASGVIHQKHRHAKTFNNWSLPLSLFIIQVVAAISVLVIRDDMYLRTRTLAGVFLFSLTPVLISAILLLCRNFIANQGWIILRVVCLVLWAFAFILSVATKRSVALGFVFTSLGWAVLSSSLFLFKRKEQQE